MLPGGSAVPGVSQQCIKAGRAPDEAPPVWLCGGVQCPKVRWRHCEACQARLASAGLGDEYELQSWFVGRVNAFLRARGRQLIGWDEILEGGLSPGAMVMSWRVCGRAVGWRACYTCCAVLDTQISEKLNCAAPDQVCIACWCFPGACGVGGFLSLATLAHAFRRWSFERLQQSGSMLPVSQG